MPSEISDSSFVKTQRFETAIDYPIKNDFVDKSVGVINSHFDGAQTTNVKRQLTSANANRSSRLLSFVYMLNKYDEAIFQM